MVGKTSQPFDDTSLLTKEEQDLILRKAKDEVQKERADAASKAFLEKALAAERQKGGLAPAEEEIVPILIDVPGFSPGLNINNRMFFHGVTYQVPISRARDMMSMMARAWEHENEVGGANRDSYRKPANQTIRPGSM